MNIIEIQLLVYNKNKFQNSCQHMLNVLYLKGGKSMIASFFPISWSSFIDGGGYF
jgi:hypothetical protein